MPILFWFHKCQRRKDNDAFPWRTYSATSLAFSISGDAPTELVLLNILCHVKMIKENWRDKEIEFPLMEKLPSHCHTLLNFGVKDSTELL